MTQKGPRISYGGEEATFPEIRREVSQRWFSRGTELAVLHSFCPQPNTTVPFLPEFDPSSQFGDIGEKPSMFRYQFRDLSPLVSSDGPKPLLWSSLQSDTSSSCDSLPGGPLSLVTSELKQPPWDTQLLWPLQKHEIQPQIYQAVNHLPFHPVLETGLQMEMELPSNQSHHDIMNAPPWANQQIKMHQIVGMNSLSPFQSDAAQNQTGIIPEPVPISHSNCGTMVINGSQGENTCCSVDGALSNHLTRKRICVFEEDITEPFDGSTLSLACLPSVCSTALSLQTMPIQPVSEIHLAKRQAVNHLPFHPVLETGLQMEMELPSNQSHDDIMNASPWANQQIEMRQIVGMNSLSPFQSDAAQNQTVIISEPVPISHSNCGTMVINGSQGENTCCSIDGALSNHLTRKRIGAFEEDITEPFDGSTLSLACLPSVCSTALSLQTMPIQPVSEIHLAKRQKKNEIAESEASATPPKALAFYNFMELRHNDYVAERDAIANQCNRSWEVCDIIDLDLKL